VSFNLLNQLLVAFVVAVTIIVVAVPEGLPMMVNVSLALNMRKMAKENCLVRQLVASETIGSSNIICTDKTGTLTQNQMQPVWFFLGATAYEKSQVHDAANTPEWNKIVRNIAINSLANIEIKNDSISGVGNPTECALLLLLHEHGIDYRNLRDAHSIMDQVDYNSKRKMSLAMAQVDGHNECYLKGAPELVLARCSHISINGKPVPMNGYRDEILKQLSAATSDKALRVIAFSEKVEEGTSVSYSRIEDWLKRTDGVFIGIIGIADPIRPEVPGAVATCKRAGVDVKMITGDDPRTAISIARQAGIFTEGDLMMTSAEFSKVDESTLPSVASKICVMARSSPGDKYRLVQALHKLGNVVAVTGDGTNDAPALKAADVGLSMGKCGTEVAKEASDIVLVDDNFASIVTAVRWGRTLYENIQRFIQFQLSVNVVALLCAFIGPLMGIPLPLTVPQLLWINIIMDTFAALALSTEPSRPGTMNRPPVRRDAHIIMPSMMVTIGISSLYQVALLLVLLGTNFLGGQTELEKLTIFFTVFVMFQFWHKFNCRSLRHDESPFQRLWLNKNFIVIVTIITLAQILMVQIGGPIGELFRTMPIRLETWLWILLLTATILPVAWLARQIAHWTGAEKVRA
jgi:Ca2+-transporting ATPase